MYYAHIADSFKQDAQKLKKEDKKLHSKVLELIINTLETPYEGIGKPEALKGDSEGYWSRRIDAKHRLIYKVEGDAVEFISCYGHYGDK